MQVILAHCLWDNLKPATHFNIINIIMSGKVHGICSSIGSILPDTRNNVMNQVLTSYPDFTHVLFIDGDMGGINQDIIQGLIDADKDIIGAVAVRRAVPFVPCFAEKNWPEFFKQMEKEQKDRIPIEVNSVGFGCTLIKREVILRAAEKVDDQVQWFNLDRHPRDEFFTEISIFEKELAIKDWPRESDTLDMIRWAFKEGVKFGLSAHLGSKSYGEDYSFCLKAKALGFTVWVHSGLYVSHIGDMAYSIEDYFDFQKYKKTAKRLEQGVKVERNIQRDVETST